MRKSNERNPGFVRHSHLPIHRWKCPECGVSMKGDMQRFAVTDGRCALCDLRYRRREDPALTPDEAEYLRATKRLAAGRNPSPSWHQDAAREYAGKLRADAAAGHDAADYWQGALAAESRALAMSNPGYRISVDYEPNSFTPDFPWKWRVWKGHAVYASERERTELEAKLHAKEWLHLEQRLHRQYREAARRNPRDEWLRKFKQLWERFADTKLAHREQVEREGILRWALEDKAKGYTPREAVMHLFQNPGRGSRRRDYRRNPDSQLTEWIEGVLANDEEATDEELVDLFMSEGGLSPTEARAWVAKRGQYLAGVIDLKRRVKRNPDYSKIKGFEPWMANHPQFVQAVNKFVEFHGVMPESINKKDMPGLGNPGDKQFLVQMGKAMDTTYKPTHKGSSKYGSAYIHEFGEGLGRKPKNEDLPDQACTPDGKSIVTFGGKFEVKDWVRR